MRTNDLLNAIAYLLTAQAAQSPAQKQRPVSFSLSKVASEDRVKAPVLVGDDYYAAKQTLITQEAELLRLMRFDILTEHPHKFLFNYAHTLQCQPCVLQLALCLVNDSLRFTLLSVECSAADLAGGALHLSSLLLGKARELPFEVSSCWWHVLGLQLTRLESIGRNLLAMLEQTKASG